MTISLTSLLNRDVFSAKLTFDSGDLKWEFYPGRLTVGFIKRMTSLEETVEGADRMIQEFASLIHSWSLTDDDGEVIEVTPETCADLPVDVLQLMVGKMASADAPKAQTSTSSSGPSETPTSTKSKSKTAG